VTLPSRPPSFAGLFPIVAARTAGDAAAAAWLWFAYRRFTDAQGSAVTSTWAISVVVPLAAALIGLRARAASGSLQVAGRAAALAALLAALGFGAGRLGWVPVTLGQSCWLGVAVAVLILGMRTAGRPGPAALIRWVLIGSAGFAAMLPFYYSGQVGAGDANWYTLMLADCTAQLRSGIFPVWVGQSVYAFNGAVMPIRFAPGFQYFGGALDLLTAHALYPAALKNLTLAATALLGVGSAYFCLSRVARGRPWLAALLSAAWILGPGVLAPVVAGDQYMTFMTLPALPIALYGCWLTSTRDDSLGPFVAAAGLAGTWLCHPPVAFWTTLFAVAVCLHSTFRPGPRHRRRAAVFVATFVVLGSYPFVSVLSLENRFENHASGGIVVEMVRNAFPKNFLPIAAGGPYQLGYFLIGILAVSLLAASLARTRGAWPFLAASLLVAPLTLPVPWVTAAFWVHAPDWLVQIDKVWPMQRFFLIWSTLIVFAAAAALRDHPRLATRGSVVALALPLLGGLAWTACEMRKLEYIPWSPKAATRLLENPDDAILSRYIYSVFEFTPAYASHGFMDAWWENRLLDRRTQQLVVSNADAAAPVPGSSGAPGVSRHLVASGALRAENLTSSDYYRLTPDLTLEPGRHYALRLEFSPRDLPGILELSDPGLFREYLLPDSGADLPRNGGTRAFGSLPWSSHVLSLTALGPAASRPVSLLITPGRDHRDFDAGRFWLYDYDRATLPVAVESWMPYRARVDASRSLYLETPRVWLSGWRARVDGRPTPTLRSKQNLVMVPVESGRSTVTLTYEPSFLLAASFGLAVAGWAAVAVVLASGAQGYRWVTSALR